MSSGRIGGIILIGTGVFGFLGSITGNLPAMIGALISPEYLQSNTTTGTSSSDAAAVDQALNIFNYQTPAVNNAVAAVNNGTLANAGEIPTDLGSLSAVNPDKLNASYNNLPSSAELQALQSYVAALTTGG
jgi:hypothetical protein